MLRIFSALLISVTLLCTLLFVTARYSMPALAAQSQSAHERSSSQSAQQIPTSTLQIDVTEIGAARTTVKQNKEIQPILQDLQNADQLREQMLEISPLDRAADLPVRGAGTGKILAASKERRATLQVGDQVEWLVYDSVCNVYSPEMFTIRAVSSHAEVWVQNDLGYKKYDNCTDYNLTDNPIHPNKNDAKHITSERIANLLEQFESYIWPTDVSYFGAYDSHNGAAGSTVIYNIPLLLTDNGERVIIMISNIRDDNFYEPAENPGFIAGFYSSFFEGVADRNMVTLDSKQWNLRQGAPLYMYDSTLAHELQHLIHDDYDSSEKLWVNEGLSEFAEFLVGYRTSTNHGRSRWQKRPENSLTEWGDQDREEITADYQLSYLFMIYVAGRLGGDAQALKDVAALTRNPSSGVIGFDAWLQNSGSTLTFNQLYRDFRLHMVHGGDTSDAQPKAQWTSGYIDSYVSPLMNDGGNATSKFDLSLLRESLTFEGYSSAGVPPFGSDYIEIGYSAAITGSYPIYFEGIGTNGQTGWSQTSVMDISVPAGVNIPNRVYYSGHTDETDNFAVFGPLTLPPPSTNSAVTPTNILTFDHFYNIEQDWDFGFLQVTTDTTGLTGWISVNVTGMQTVTNPAANVIIADNVPGYGGHLSAWESVSVDLNSYAGQPFLLAFRYATDGGTGGNRGSNFTPGWTIANAKIGATPLDTNAARGIYEIRNASSGSYIVNFVTYSDGYGKDVSTIYTMSLSSNLTGTLDLGEIALSNTGFDEVGERGVIVVTSNPLVASENDLVGSGYQSAYADYRLTNVPPGINTSDSDIDGNAVGFKGVYPNGTMTVTVVVDNIGASPSISATQAITGVACARIPDNAKINLGSEVGGANYVSKMSAVGASFPADPGVCYMGLVDRTQKYTFTMTADTDLQIGNRVVVTTFFASDVITIPEQFETDVESLRVRAPFALSIHAAAQKTVFNGSTISFTTTAINLDDNPRDAILAFVLPPNTTFERVKASGTYTVSISSGVIFIQDTIDPYSEFAPQTYTFFITPTAAAKQGDLIKGVMVIRDGASDQLVELSDVTQIEGVTLYFPYLVR